MIVVSTANFLADKRDKREMRALHNSAILFVCSTLFGPAVVIMFIPLFVKAYLNALYVICGRILDKKRS
jgi:hypothetical protein